MSNGKRKPPGTGRGHWQQPEKAHGAARRPPVNTPHSGASPFDAPTMYQPQGQPRHTPKPDSPFDAPTMLHQGQPQQGQQYHTGQHPAADELPLPEGPEQGSPFDAPTMFQASPGTGMHPSFPPSHDGNPFDAPTMLHQGASQQHQAPSHRSASSHRNTGDASYPPPSGQSWREARSSDHYDARAAQEPFGEFREFGDEAQPGIPVHSQDHRRSHSYYGNPTPTHDELELPQEDDLFTGDIPDVSHPHPSQHSSGVGDYNHSHHGGQVHNREPSYGGHRDPHVTPAPHDYAQDNDDATSYMPHGGTGQLYTGDFDSNPSYNRQSARYHSPEWNQHHQSAQHHYQPAHSDPPQAHWSGHHNQDHYQEPYGGQAPQDFAGQSHSSHYQAEYGQDPGYGQEAQLEQESFVEQAADYGQQAAQPHQYHDPQGYAQNHDYQHHYGAEPAYGDQHSPSPHEAPWSEQEPYYGHHQTPGYSQEPHYQQEAYQQDPWQGQGYAHQEQVGSASQPAQDPYANYGQYGQEYGAQEPSQPPEAAIVVGQEVGAFEEIDVAAALQAASFREVPAQSDPMQGYDHSQPPAQGYQQEAHPQQQAHHWEGQPYAQQGQQEYGGHQDAYGQAHQEPYYQEAHQQPAQRWDQQPQQHQGDWAQAQVHVPDAYNPYANAASQHQTPQHQTPQAQPSDWQANSPSYDEPARAHEPASHSRDAFAPSNDQSREGPGDLIARLRDALGSDDIQPREDPVEAWRSLGVFQEDAVMLDPGEAMLLEERIEAETSNVLASSSTNGVALAELFWQQLHQALKKLSLYQQQQRRNIASYFVSAMGVLRAYNKHHGDLVFTVRPFDFMLGESSIFTSESHENSPTYKLYGAGVRALTIAEGVPLTEMVAFGQCLALTPQELQEEDIASRLWRADLRKITTLQVQSIEIAQEGEEDIDDLAQLVAMLTAQLHTDDPNNAVNFRGIDALDLLAGGALMNAETERVFGTLPALARREEAALWHRVRAVEEAALATYGCQLYSGLFKHIESAYHKMYGHRPEHPPLDVVELFAPHMVPLCDHLLLEHDFTHMAILLDAIEWQTTQSHSHKADPWRRLLRQLSDRMSSPENVALLLAHLREAPQLEQAQEDALGVYLHFLGADVQRALIEALPELAPKVRRLLLEVMCTAPRARGLLQVALGQLQEHEQVLLELLQVAGEHTSTMPRGSLRLLLRHKNQRIQTKAFLLLAQENPDEAREVADTLLLQTSPEARASVVDILCEKDEDGVYLVLSFAHSDGFAKLPEADQQTLYARLGRTKEPAVIDDCIEALSHKSQLLKPQIDRRKRLAITALKASQTDAARKQLELALQTELHSKKIRAELADALKTMWT